MKLKQEASELEAAAPVKEKYIFEPKANAFSTEPSKTVEYTMHDWKAAMNKVDELVGQLTPIQDNLHAALFFAPKDPAAWLTVTAQLSFLLVAVARMDQELPGRHGESISCDAWPGRAIDASLGAACSLQCRHQIESRAPAGSPRSVHHLLGGQR
jgi:hypothetical protein